MKKSILLLAVGLGALSATAQMANESIVRLQNKGNSAAELTTKRPVLGRTAAAHKTTSSGGSDWFFYDIAVDAGGGGTTAALIDCYPDSNIYYPSGTPSPFYIWAHGIGTSFDPTSYYFNTAWVPTTITAPSIVVYPYNSYTVDSIDIAGLYQQKNPAYTDTLYIELTYTSDTGAFEVTYSGAGLVTDGIIPTPAVPADTTWTIADAYYNWNTNAIDGTNTAPVWRFTKILNTAASVDTTTSGLNEWHFPMAGSAAVSLNSPSRPWPIVVPAGKHVVAYAHFASAHAYPMGTNNTAANLWRAYSEDFALSPLETFKGDENSGLLSSTEDRFHVVSGTTKEYSYLNLTGGATAPILSPTYFYTAPLAVHNPWFGFHLTCATCPSLTSEGTPEISNIKSVNAYPNPVASDLTITYSLQQNADVTVTLTNMLGQTVATQAGVNGKAVFSTTNLPAGVYIFSLQANGVRSTGRVSIAH